MSDELTPIVATDNEWVILQKQCVAFVRSGLLPRHITDKCDEKTAVARAITIAIKGRELGIPPLQAFASISVISGKPCLSSELMLALVFSRVKGAKVTFRTPPEKAHECCEVEMQRPGGEMQMFRFTMDDAKRAGLLGNQVWSKYPAAMLRARAMSAGARAVFPDAIMGCYTPEEMGGEVPEAELEAEVPKALSAVIEESASGYEAPALTDAELKVQRTLDERRDAARAELDAAPNATIPLITDSQRGQIFSTALRMGYLSDEVYVLAGNLFSKKLDDLTWSEVNKLIKHMKDNKP